MRNLSLKTSLIVIFVVAVAAFVGVITYMNSGDSLSTQNSSTSPSPANATQSPANQTTVAQPQNSPKPEADRSTTDTVVRGTVTKEGGAGVAGAVVVLFNGDRRGAEPQKVDENGRFRFDKIPVKSDASYSLQTKVPGFCGEKIFTSTLIDAGTINADIVLKPCQTEAPAPAPVKTEDPGLLRVSEGLTGIVDPLNSMKSWVKSLTITYILTILVLLLATLGLIFLNRRQSSDERERIDGLFRWRQTVDGELKKLTPPPGGGPPTTLMFPKDLLETLRQVSDAVTTLASAIQQDAGQTGNSDFEPGLERGKTPGKTLTPAYQGSYNSPANEDEWYRKLQQNDGIFPPPLYVQINSALSDTSMLSNTRQICFDEGQNHGPFVIYEERDGAGWIFPSPGSNFTADHHRVFDQLDQKNFDQQRANITKKQVLIQEGHWRLVL